MEHNGGTWPTEALAMMTSAGGFPHNECAEQQHRDRYCEAFKATSGRLRCEADIQKHSPWSRRIQQQQQQQHPFIPGGEIAMRRARSRKQRSQRSGGGGCGGGRAGGLHFRLGSYWGEKSSGDRIRLRFTLPLHKKKNAHAIDIEDEASSSSHREVVESSHVQDSMDEDVKLDGDDLDATWSKSRDSGSEKDSLMYSLEGRSCPPAPRHEPQYLREGTCSFQEWGASRQDEHPGATKHEKMKRDLKSPLRRIDRQLEDFRRIVVYPSRNIPLKIRKKLDHQDSMIDSLEADNYSLREKLMELTGKLSVAASYPMSPSLADNFPMDGYSHSKERVF